MGIKYSSAGLGPEEAFPASCIANSTPQLKSAPRGNSSWSLILSLSWILTRNVIHLCAPEYTSSSLECCVANTEPICNSVCVLLKLQGRASRLLLLMLVWSCSRAACESKGWSGCSEYYVALRISIFFIVLVVRIPYNLLTFSNWNSPVVLSQLHTLKFLQGRETVAFLTVKLNIAV